ncbi:extracellular solute-binding protein [Aurantimonas sp. MSK8Z-1]|uniref:ABC transporter substrate-binding protein n=1 Tax=Mangrovibrevibacter kandeliae TaxID=2968473 RepID=UPI0021185896|nr:extracellular solute-binding protein [Aurantimonas sp. MSK8Z-1]MCW4115452.1 extracellular solute-binding protein [Aurantimonas sp. MSK8Z-1]
MNRREVTFALGSVAAAGLFPWSRAHAASPDLVAAAEKEGKVVWYTTMIVDQSVRPLAEAFQKKYPKIAVEFTRAGSGDTALKIINEGQAGRVMGDVFDGTATFASVMPAGFVEPYRPESAAAYPDEFKSTDGSWHALNFYYLTAAYNTDLVSADEAPKTYDDLLDEKWKGQLVWSVVPEPVAAPGFIGNMLLTKGKDAGTAYLDKLAAQGVTNMSSSQRTVLDRVIVGDFPIGLMVFNHHVEISKAQGAPIEWLRMEPLVSSASLLGLIKGGPNPNAGKLFIDWLLSEEGQRVLASTSYLPTRPGVDATIPTLLPTGPQHFDTTFMSPTIVADNLKDWIAILDEKFT